MGEGNRKQVHTHRQVNVNGIMVDEGIAPLLKVLWSLGINAVDSCECDEDHLAWIRFDNSAEAFKFFKPLAKWLGLLEWSQATEDEDVAAFPRGRVDVRFWIEDLDFAIDIFKDVAKRMAHGN
jgi:hypothetical protein